MRAIVVVAWWAKRPVKAHPQVVGTLPTQVLQWVCERRLPTNVPTKHRIGCAGKIGSGCARINAREGTGTFFFDVLQELVLDPPWRPSAAGGTAKPSPRGCRGHPGWCPLQHLERPSTARAPARAPVVGGRHEPLHTGNIQRPYGGRSRGVWLCNMCRVRVAKERRGGTA